MPNVAHVAWPYKDPDEVVQTTLDPATTARPARPDFRTWLEWLAVNADEEECGRIIVGTAILWDAKAGRLGECLDTAVIWERG